MAKWTRALVLSILAFFLIGCWGWMTLRPWAQVAGFGLAGAWLLIGLVFFRNPPRVSNAPENAILAPADGRIMAIERIAEPQFLQSEAIRIAIFMHLGNVHVQRLPAPGRLRWMRHRKGSFKPAFAKTAHLENEQRIYALQNQEFKYLLIQIAGLVARRTISWLSTDRTYGRGEPLGMIAFGSEVDLYLPVETRLLVEPGARVRAGITILGEWPREIK